MPTADHGDVHGEASKERAGEGGDLAVRPVHRRAAGEEHAGVVPGGLRERGDASGLTTAQFNTILNEPSVIIFQIRVNMCLPESVPRVTPHLETRITDTLFA